MTLPKPAKEKQRDKVRTRARLLLAARCIFARNGFEGTSMESIAREAGVSKGLIYHYFNSRDALFIEALDAEVAGLRTRQADLELRALEPVQAIRRLTTATFDYFSENPRLISLLNEENRLEGRLIRRSDALTTAYDALIDALDDILQRGRAEGLFRSGITSLSLYLSIAGLCFHYSANRHTLGAVFRRSFSDPEEIEKRRAEIVDFVMHGVAATSKLSAL
ncbi:MAG: TetR/AcrR family transcriptional regulator [Sulfitobacter sp.]